MFIYIYIGNIIYTKNRCPIHTHSRRSSALITSRFMYVDWIWIGLKSNLRLLPREKELEKETRERWMMIELWVLHSASYDNPKLSVSIACAGVDADTCHSATANIYTCSSFPLRSDLFDTGAQKRQTAGREDWESPGNAAPFTLGDLPRMHCSQEHLCNPLT